MNRKREREIIPGITLDEDGEATVSSELGEVLDALAEELSALLSRPIDTEHVLIAVILAVRAGEIPPETSLTANDPQLRTLLAPHVKLLLDRYGGNVCEAD